MLNRLRKEIDEIDRDLLSLFERRMDVAVQIGAYKSENNLPVLDEKREEEVIKKRIEAANNPAYKELTADFFKSIMALSRRLQKENLSAENKQNNE